MNYYIIPARKNSKGFRFKNRYLFEDLPKELANHKVIVTSDDDVIRNMNEKLYGFDFLQRPSDLALDETSIKPVLQHVIREYKLTADDTLIVLYLTYPERTYEDIQSILSFYHKNNAKSLLCREPLVQHPYLCFETTDDHKAKRIVPHNLYRRQDYPECFFGSHFVAIVNVGILSTLDLNLHNEDQTIFYDLQMHKIDVDHKTDLK